MGVGEQLLLNNRRVVSLYDTARLKLNFMITELKKIINGRKKKEMYEE
jgi:hypothetical protein